MNEKTCKVQEVVAMVQRYVERHQIKDEDTIQELYLTAMESWNKGQSKGRILGDINRRHRSLEKKDEQEIIEDEFYDFIDEVILKYEIMRCLEKAKGSLTLTPREKLVLKMEINDENGEYIAKVLGITRVRVWQIRKHIYKKLRIMLRGF